MLSHHSNLCTRLYIRNKRVRTLKAVTLGDANDVDHLVLGEHLVDGQCLLKVLARPVHFLADAAAVELDLHQVSFLLTLLQQLHLSEKKYSFIFHTELRVEAAAKTDEHKIEHFIHITTLCCLAQSRLNSKPVSRKAARVCHQL